MAIASVGTLGTGAHSTSAASFTFNTATNSLAAGDIGILVVNADNSGTGGATNEITSVSGGTGTWTKLGENSNGNGAPGAGVTDAVFMFQASGSVPTGTTITVNLAAAVTDKCCSFWKFTVGANKTLVLSDETSQPKVGSVDAGNGFGSIAFSALASETRLYFAGLGKEANSTTQITPNAGFTAITAIRSRNNAAAILTRGQFRINTSTGETSNPTLAVTGDAINVFFALEEVDLSNPVTVTPGAFSLAYTPAAPTVTASDHKTATPGAFSLAFTPAAPDVRLGINVTPGAFSLAFAPAAPTVTASDHKTAIPGAFSLAFTPAAPTVVASDHKTVTPGAFALAMTMAAPTVNAGVTVTPGAFSLIYTPAAPTVAITEHVRIEPGPFSLTFTPAAPTVTATGDEPPAPPPAYDGVYESYYLLAQKLKKKRKRLKEKMLLLG